MGAAAERFVEKSLFKELIKAVQEHPNTILSVGGNAALMANRIAKLGGRTLLCGVGPKLKTLLNGAIDTVASSEDEYHLILEYSAGEVFYDTVTERANRFILHSDESNGKILALESCHNAAEAFQPDIMVAAGLHLLQEQTTAFRSARLTQVRAQLQSSVPRDVALHLELASIGDPLFLRQLADSLLNQVDSIGLNEQELGDLYVACGGDKFTSADFQLAPTTTVLEALAYIFEFSDGLTKTTNENNTNTNNNNNNNDDDDQHNDKPNNNKHFSTRQLTRIHFHYLTYHVIAVRGAAWRNTANAVAAGSAAATNQACMFGDAVVEQSFDATLVELRTPFVERSTASLMATLATSGVLRSGVGQYFLAPVLVCKKPIRTVGLGDAVSSSSLASQQFQSQQ